MAGIRIERLTDGATLADAHTVRRTVFIDEQDVPAALEMDEKDDAARHLVAYDGEQPVGTARLREPQPGVGKVERVAVIASYRERGLGMRLMTELEVLAAELGHVELRLHAQTSVEGFYHKLGYTTVSDVFEEAGIPHVAMEKRLE